MDFDRPRPRAPRAQWAFLDDFLLLRRRMSTQALVVTLLSGVLIGFWVAHLLTTVTVSFVVPGAQSPDVDAASRDGERGPVRLNPLPSTFSDPSDPPVVEYLEQTTGGATSSATTSSLSPRTAAATPERDADARGDEGRRGTTVVEVRDAPSGSGKYIVHRFAGSASKEEFEAQLEASAREAAAKERTPEATTAVQTPEETPAETADTLLGEGCTFAWGCGGKYSASPAELAAMSIDGSGWPKEGEEIHVLMTSNGVPYLNFQTRLLYRTFLRAQRMPGGDKMVAFTRILSRAEHDDISHEVPTFRTDPITPACDKWCEFPVADRPNSVRQFLQAAERDPTLIKAPWLLVIEGDYAFIRPVRAPPAESDAPDTGFPFFYINPQAFSSLIRPMYPASAGPLTDIPPSGPAPILARARDWAQLTPDWERLTLHIENTAQAKERLGWVREMYAFSIAAALQGISLDLKRTPKNELIAQPPNDQVVGEAAMLHYTWGALWFDNERRSETAKYKDSTDILQQIKFKYGPEVWRFEKRDFWAPEHARRIGFQPMPPSEWDASKKWTMQAGEPVTKELWDIETLLVGTLNEAAATLDDLTLATAQERRKSVEDKMAQWLSEHPGEKLDWFDIERDYVPSGEGADT